MKENDVIVFKNQELKLEVNLKDETVWLTQKQIAELFCKDENTINEHINNIFREGELEKETSTGISGKSTGGRKSKIYNLDVIISVGYRVKSQNGIIFRRWANKVLKDYLLKGYVINQDRLNMLEKTVKIIDIANRINLEDNESTNILKVINSYSKSLDLLDDYDHKKVLKINGSTNDKKITYNECIDIINTLKFNENSSVFALERNKGLEGIIGNLYQTYNNKDVYLSVEEKASNFLYLIIKNHVFIDGNKRIGATLFIYFLNYYKILYNNGSKVIDNNTLTAITLLIAESDPKEKDIMVDLVTNFLV